MKNELGFDTLVAFNSMQDASKAYFGEDGNKSLVLFVHKSV